MDVSQGAVLRMASKVQAMQRQLCSVQEQKREIGAASGLDKERSHAQFSLLGDIAGHIQVSTWGFQGEEKANKH